MQSSGTKHKSKAVQNLFDKFKDAGNPADKGTFKFPPPPILHESRLSPLCNSDTSDSQAGSVRGKKFSSATKSNSRVCRTDSESDKLPPIGVFWDIENCQIPHGKSALTIVQAIRNTFFDEYREAEFTVVCDVHKESPVIIQELNDAQVDLLHVISSSKNAADEKLRQAIRRFADLHGTPSAVVLISSDINFAPDLSDLRHRKKIHVILLHATNCSESLIMCANEHYNFGEFVQPLPSRNQQVVDTPQSADIFVWNLPMTQGDQRIRWRLKTLSQNCGGRIIVISRPMAVLRFPTLEMAMRAQKRMDGELVFGHPIRVGVSHFMDPPIRLDSNFVPLSRSRSGNSFSLSTNGGPSYREPNHSSFLPINPNPWIYQNGASQFSFDFNNRPSKPYEDSVPNGGATSSGFSQSPSPWRTKEEDKSELLKRAQNVLNGFTQLNVSSVNGVSGGSQTVGNPDNIKRYSYPSNGSSNIQKGWTNLTPTFTTAFDNPRNWADATSKNRRTSPVNNNNTPHRHRQNSGGDSGWNSMKSTGNRKCRTPSPYMLNDAKMAHPLPVKPAGLNPADAKEGPDSRKKRSPSSPTGGDVELHVTNLDQTYDPLEMKKMLASLFGQHVLGGVRVSVFVQADQTYAASVMVPSPSDGQLLISRFHRRKLSFGKINVSFALPVQKDFQYLRWQTISLLQDVPQDSLPLLKFLNMFESRYMNPVSVVDILKLSDVCTVSDESGGRMISLNPEYRDAASSTFQTTQEIPPHCAKHYVLHQTLNKGWAEQEARPLPNVVVPLPIFSANIKELLASHGNVLPLSSLSDCYNVECGPLNATDHGVPLEHYVTCVSQVELVTDPTRGIKYLRPGTPKSLIAEMGEVESPSISPSLATAFKQFEREVVDLLKIQPRCQLLFNKFVPAYHNHFGRQCRVADYGFTKLIELLEAVSHVIQVMGEGNKRMVTLSHRAQIRRFTVDLIRALKAQPVKRMSFAELPAVFERVLGRAFDPVDYGLCFLNDLVNLLSDSSVSVDREGVLSIPQRKRTEVEEKRTKQFAQEVVELLSSMPNYSIEFDGFIPAYHHYFSQQCRLSDFGFAKLMELFEAIPDTVKIEEDSEGRTLTLTIDKKIEALSEQMINLVYPAWPPGLHLNTVETRYLWHYGYGLNPAAYNAADLEELIGRLDSVKIVVAEDGKVVVPLEGALLKQIATKVRAFLINADGGRMPLAKLRSHFSVYHEPHLTPQKLLKNLPDVVQVDEEDGVIVVELTPVYQFIRQLVRLMVKSEGRLKLAALGDAYEKEFGAALDLSPFGYATVEDLMLDAPNVFAVRGRGPRRQAQLSREINYSLRKPLHPVTSSGVTIGRPPSSCSISDTSIPTSGDESTGKSPTPLLSLPELSTPALRSNLYSPCKALATIQPTYSLPPDPSELPQPLMHLVSKPDKENEAFDPTHPDLFTDRPGSGLSSHSGNESATPGSSGQKRRTRVRLAAQFNQPLKKQ